MVPQRSGTHQLRECCPARRRLVVRAVVDADGAPLPSTTSELKQMDMRRRLIFGAEWHPQDAAARRLHVHGNVLTRQEVSALQACSLDGFATMVLQVRDGSLGPEGLP